MDMFVPIMLTPPVKKPSSLLVLYQPEAPVNVLSSFVMTTLPFASARPVDPSYVNWSAVIIMLPAWRVSAGAAHTGIVITPPTRAATSKCCIFMNILPTYESIEHDLLLLLVARSYLLLMHPPLMLFPHRSI